MILPLAPRKIKTSASSTMPPMEWAILFNTSPGVLDYNILPTLECLPLPPLCPWGLGALIQSHVVQICSPPIRVASFEGEQGRKSGAFPVASRWCGW